LKFDRLGIWKNESDRVCNNRIPEKVSQNPQTTYYFQTTLVN